MLAQEIIRAKRDGHKLDAGTIGDLVAGLTDGSLSDSQAAAFAMAVFFKGLDIQECAALTHSMTHSGRVLDWSAEKLAGPILDKHSTGGVGDNVSLILAPAIAACGGYVPMISGRGLGHTGGTLDKLDAIPGYVAQPDEAEFRRVLRICGCAIIGQTADLAPADKRLYAIRDVTATVESVPLITASILSKKLAAGLGGLVMDVKTGSGAFMPTLEGSRALAQSIVRVAAQAGLPTHALITDMNQPLASAAGNAVEMANALDYLAGRHRDARLHAVVLALGAQMLLLGGLAQDRAAALARLARAIDSGAAAEHFARMVAELGGPRDLMENAAKYLAQAPVVAPVVADADGFISHIDTRAIGIAVVELGGGRRLASDAIDPSVGFTALAGLGAPVRRGEPLGFVHARSIAGADAAGAALRLACRIGPLAPPVASPIIEIVGMA